MSKILKIGKCLLVLTLTFCILGASIGQAKPPDNKGNNGNSGHSDNKGKGNNNGNNGNNGKQGGDVGHLPGTLRNAGITVLDARNVASGLNMTGYQALPPGIKKNLGRGKPLPPGIAKKMVPNDMLKKLPKYDGYEWQMLGTDLVLVSIVSGIISDVLNDVFK